METATKRMRMDESVADRFANVMHAMIKSGAYDQKLLNKAYQIIKAELDDDLPPRMTLMYLYLNKETVGEDEASVEAAKQYTGVETTKQNVRFLLYYHENGWLKLKEDGTIDEEFWASKVMAYLKKQLRLDKEAWLVDESDTGYETEKTKHFARFDSMKHRIFGSSWNETLQHKFEDILHRKGFWKFVDMYRDMATYGYRRIFWGERQTKRKTVDEIRSEVTRTAFKDESDTSVRKVMGLTTIPRERVKYLTQVLDDWVHSRKDANGSLIVKL